MVQQTQNGVNFDFQFKFDLDLQIWWSWHEWVKSYHVDKQRFDPLIHTKTDAGKDNTRGPKLASDKKSIILRSNDNS